MFCKYCGAKLSDEALFCTECGSAVPGRGESALGDQSGPTEPASNTAEDDQDAGVVGLAEGAMTDSVTFSAAMDSAKRRGRRKMPVIVLVALALLLLSSVAFAAYWAYQEFFAPEPAPVEQPSSSETALPPEPEPAADETAALNAFEEVVAQYQEAMDYAAANIQADAVREEDAFGTFQEDYPLANTLGVLDVATNSIGSPFGLCYALVDIDGDGDRELAIGLPSTGYRDGLSNFIVQAYSYEGDSGLQVLCEGVYRTPSYICQGGMLLTMSSGGYDVGRATFYRYADGAVIESESLEWNYYFENRDRKYMDHTFPDGTVEHLEFVEGEFPDDVYNAFLAEHPERTDMEWTPLDEYPGELS